MPGRSRKVYKTKKSFRSTGSGGSGFSDVTVYDYAHVDKPMTDCVRLKKGANVFSQKQAKMLGEPEKPEAELDWFDKDLDDFVIKDPDNPTEDDADDVAVECTRKYKAGRKPAILSANTGVDYPIDIWFMLSRYIQPEDISTFARLCQAANAVIQSPLFWRQLYYRFFNKDVRLPESLGLASVERSHGLRARVLQALHYLYPPFISLCKLSTAFHDEPHQLEGKRCVTNWHQNIADNVWRFNFKLRREKLNGRSEYFRPNGSVDLVNGYNDVFYNPEAGCCVLQVSCKNYMKNPMVMGLVLTKVYLNVSQGMRHHRLRLIFDSRMKTVGKGTVTGTQIVLDPVLNVRVFHWWDPQYQHAK